MALIRTYLDSSVPIAAYRGSVEPGNFAMVERVLPTRQAVGGHQ